MKAKFDAYVIAKTLEILIDSMSRLSEMNNHYLKDMGCRELELEARLQSLESTIRRLIVELSEKNTIKIQNIED